MTAVASNNLTPKNIITRHKYMAAVAKKILPLANRLFMRGPFTKIPPFLELWAQIIQGKGGGTGWDFNGEMRCTLDAIENLKPTLIDVGANRGEWSRRMQNHFNGQAAIIMVEPAESCWEKIASAEIPNSTLIKSAASDHIGTVEFFCPYPAAGLASIHKRRDTYFQHYEMEGILVPTTTIDEIVAQKKLECVDFIKIDAEGHDLFILKGAQKSLEQNKIRALSFEFGSGNINSRTFFRDVWDYLSQYKFQLARISPGGVLIPVEGYYEDLECFRGVSNYIVRFDLLP